MRSKVSSAIGIPSAQDPSVFVWQNNRSGGYRVGYDDQNRLLPRRIEQDRLVGGCGDGQRAGSVLEGTGSACYLQSDGVACTAGREIDARGARLHFVGQKASILKTEGPRAGHECK